MIVLIIVLVIIALLAVIFIGTYNKLVKSKQKVKNAFSQIDVQLQRRFDLIPNLVDTIKGYMAHEAETLEKVTELRTSWANASTVAEKAQIEGQLSSTLKSIMAVSENYPDLKANTNFIELQETLKDTENKISYARQFYNDAVTMFNTKLVVFPTNIIGSLLGFKEEELYKVDSEEARKNVKVDFNK